MLPITKAKVTGKMMILPGKKSISPGNIKWLRGNESLMPTGMDLTDRQFPALLLCGCEAGTGASYVEAE